MKTWKEAFYPTDASRFSKRNRLSLVTRLQAVNHSLRKWRGLRAAALERHKVSVSCECVVADKQRLRIDGDSCALCCLTLNGATCKECPVSLVNPPLVTESCWREGCSDEYRAWTGGKRDPEPMIKLLERVKEKLQQAIKRAKKKPVTKRAARPGRSRPRKVVTK